MMTADERLAICHGSVALTADMRRAASAFDTVRHLSCRLRASTPTDLRDDLAELSAGHEGDVERETGRHIFRQRAFIPYKASKFSLPRFKRLRIISR